MSFSSFFSPAIFLRGAASPKDFPPETLPEIAFVGRSNVGKSSLLNALLNRKNLAHISKKPGKTAQINFFEINHRFILVDMPGYGYAAVSQKMRSLWGALIPAYFEKRAALIHVFALIDSRHPPQKTDLQLINFLKQKYHPFTILLTKIDKISAPLLEVRQQHLQALVEDRPSTTILPVSTKCEDTVIALRTHLLTLL